MKVLIDTNIIIHREASKIQNKDIGVLFNWLDKLKYTKCVHPLSIEEIESYKDNDIVQTMKIKIQNYNLLKTISQDDESIKSLRVNDKSKNDEIDTNILKEVYNNRIDFLITEDRGVHRKAKQLGIDERVFKIDDFLEKAIAENPELKDYKVLAVQKEYFGKIDLTDEFFDSFKEDYSEFSVWFNKKSDYISYVCKTDEKVKAFLYLKVEDVDEIYNNITPAFEPKKRLKIGTFKVTSTGYKLGERFLKIIFDNALQYKVDEIYVTIFNKRDEQKRLIALLEEWGFEYYGEKKTNNGNEMVYVKPMVRGLKINLENPKITYPFLSRESDSFIVPIRQEYHTELFPDSYLKNESPKDYIESEPHRNALSKVYISRSHVRNLKSGDKIVFYRTGDPGKAIHTGVVTTVGVVESVITDIKNEEEFLAICRKRSVFSNEELKKHWNYSSRNRPFIVNFVYVTSYPKRPNLKWLNENGIIPDITDMPRGFRKITQEQFIKIAKYSFGK